MIVVIDSNILFNALITPDSKAGDLLLRPVSNLHRVACYYTLAELFKHQPKVVKLSKQPVEKVVDLLYLFLQKIELVNESLIEPHFWQEADRLTQDVDSFDISHVALALKTGGQLWTGDKRLITHLKKMNFDQVITTAELHEIII